jgi:bacteriocin biosynthesis cyclodehydratase domain-containing protein
VFGEERVMDVLNQLNEAAVLEDTTQTSSGLLSQAERLHYQEQVTFFSHFASPVKPGTSVPWPDVPGTGLEYQERLKQARVAIFGLGRLGSRLVRELALAGVGQITGIDNDQVSAGDINSGAWYSAEHLGNARCDATHELVSGCNPWVEFLAIAKTIGSIDEIASLLTDHEFAILSRDHFNPEEYDRFNQACLQKNVHWTSCRIIGFEFNIGPTVIPYETPCYKCFDLRQKGNLTDYEEYLLLENFLKTNTLHSGMLNVIPGIGLTALEVIKELTLFVEPATYAHLYSVNLLSLESRRHPILKIPRCTHCGRPSQGQPTIQVWQTIL